MYGGVWPLSLRAAVGSQTVKSGAFHAGHMAEGRKAEGQCLSSCIHLLTVPGGLASGAQP